MENFTAEQKLFYIVLKGKQCPFCGSTDISPDGKATKHTLKMEQKMKCDYCGGSWVDLYNLVEPIKRA